MADEPNSTAMQGQEDAVSALPAAFDPPTSSSVPSSPTRRTAGHSRNNSAAIMQRAKRSSSRLTDGSSIRSGEDESKTAVKVAVRVRPPLQPSDPGYDLIPQRFRESTCEVSYPNNLSIQSPQGQKLFVFDRVFDENTTQEGVWDYLSDSVTSFVRGYNVSILAYGQSGAGKSFTMGTSGPDDQSDTEIMGIVPRAAKALFERLNETNERPTGIQTPKRYSTQSSVPTLASLQKAANGGASAKAWELKATYVEIYNEQVRDLLVAEHVPQAERGPVAIREDTKGRILLTGLTQIAINSVDDLLAALNFGSSIRQTDATALNARSSRSHAIFSLNLIQKKSEGPESPSKFDTKRGSMQIDAPPGADTVVTIDSKLNFVDLAGSERLKNTGATGERAKEGISINAGLASLGKVISQLSSKSAHAHISYRDSRLTRLLQDSLGGNAKTFMVACVTPAQFHLSETLNTVHYAQRARAIQSKPEIQIRQEDSDKQALIDRLRAEVAFLREQARQYDPADRRPSAISKRAEGSRDREAEMQTQLLDMQENYSALSQRHAKLISELSRAQGDDEMETPEIQDASERQQRSNSFAEAVEQMVLEYEKTIQTLENSLTTNRASLSKAENALQERDTRITCLETVQQQLQARIQKAMDREANNESYLRDLESKMEGSTNGEERSATHIAELQKELARAREGETNAEEYISTLEERLAEAEQDQEIMQREVERLEHIVERQRSMGRLDNLLGELDGMGQPGSRGLAPRSGKLAQKKVNGVSHDESSENSEAESDTEGKNRNSQHERNFSENTVLADSSSAQNDVMADKVEDLTQELFDLRSEHESNLIDYDNLQQKYRTALETLAKLEYDKDTKTEARGSSSFLTDAGMKEGEKADSNGQSSSSRSVSAELPSRTASTIITVDEEDKTTTGSDTDRTERTSMMMDEIAVQDDPYPRHAPSPSPDHWEVLQEMEVLRKLNAEKDVSVAELTRTYKSLAQKHEATLKQVKGLKQDAYKARELRELRDMRDLRPSSPSLGKPSFRRKSDDMLGGMTNDRTSRSFAMLKNLAMDSFDGKPESQQRFETSLGSVMTEMHARYERIQALETELTNIRKEMESKQAIISGLTRERSSMMVTSGTDWTMVGQMRQQLVESENQIRSLQEEHSSREKDFHDQIHSLKSSLKSHQNGSTSNRLPTPNEERWSNMPGNFPETPAQELTPTTEKGEDDAMEGASRSITNDQTGEISRLQEELSASEARHQEAMESLEASEAKLQKTIAELKEQLQNEHETALSAVTADMETQKNKHTETVDGLQKQIESHKSAANDHVAKLDQMGQDYAKISKQVDDDSKSRDLLSRKLDARQALVDNLENQLKVHKNALTIHQESLENLRTSHSKEIEDMKTSMDSAETQARERQTKMEEHHGLVIQNMQADLSRSQDHAAKILSNASSALGYETDANNIGSQIKGLSEEGKEIQARHVKATSELGDVQKKLKDAHTGTEKLEAQVAELRQINEEAIMNLEKVTERDKKSSRLVEELEEQLNSTFDTQKATNHRMSTMHDETVQARIEIERQLEEQKLKNTALENQIAAFNRNSVQSNGSSNHQNRDSLSPDAAAIALNRSPSQASKERKSWAPTALPTPPPSIPLPPLPGTPNGSSTAATPTLDRATSPIERASPPNSRHLSSADAANMTHLVEEQEARIRTIEKHLYAEKQLTATLEEALVDLETSANRTKIDADIWRKKCSGLEDELIVLRKENGNSRASVQAVEEEREMRLRAEKARQALEQRMMELNAAKKKKRGTLNCF